MPKYDSVISTLCITILLVSMCELLMRSLSRCHTEPVAPLRGRRRAWDTSTTPGCNEVTNTHTHISPHHYCKCICCESRRTAVWEVMNELSVLIFSWLTPLIEKQSKQDRKHSTVDALTESFMQLRDLSCCTATPHTDTFKRIDWPHTYCSGSGGWRVAPQHGSAGPAESPQ